MRNINDWLKCCLLLLIFFSSSSSLFANESTSTPFIIDSDNVLAQNLYNHTIKILQQAAKTNNIHVHLFILNKPLGEPLVEVSSQLIRTFESSHPEESTEKKMAYLFINLFTRESTIFLGSHVQKTAALVAGLTNIQEEIVSPALSKGYHDKAIVEGVIALTTVLEDWPSVNQGSVWLQEYPILIIIKWLFVLSVIAGILWQLKRYFHRPHWETQDYSHSLLYGQNSFLHADPFSSFKDDL